MPSSNNTFTIFRQTILHPILKQYLTVLCVDSFPTGVLSQRVKQIQPQRLSDYQSDPRHCIYVLTNTDGSYMLSQQLPELFTIIIQSRQYFIHHDIVPLVHRESVDTICVVSYIDTDP